MSRRAFRIDDLQINLDAIVGWISGNGKEDCQVLLLSGGNLKGPVRLQIQDSATQRKLGQYLMKEFSVDEINGAAKGVWNLPNPLPPI